MIDAHFLVKCVKFNKRDNSKYKNIRSVNQFEPVHAIHIKSGYAPSCASLNLAFIFLTEVRRQFFLLYSKVSLLCAPEKIIGSNEIISQEKKWFSLFDQWNNNDYWFNRKEEKINSIFKQISFENSFDSKCPRRQIWRTLVWLIVLNKDWKKTELKMFEKKEEKHRSDNKFRKTIKLRRVKDTRTKK